MNLDKLKAELRGNQLYLKERYDIKDQNARKIGYGHDLNRNPLPEGWTIPITFNQAEALLVIDAQRIETECDQRLSGWVKRDDARQIATAMLVYALGIEAVAGMVDMNRSIREGKYDVAALKVEASAYARDEPDIAKRVAELMRSIRAA